MIWIMYTEKLFWPDPYLTKCTAIVLSVEKNIIVLDRTIIYACAGGQESDHGTIAGYEILEAKKFENIIKYTISENHTIQTGDIVTCTIDWTRRYKLMRLHFAAEIVYQIITKQWPEITTNKIGSHIAFEKARIDFHITQMNIDLANQINIIQNTAQKLLDENHTILCEFENNDTNKRYWKIENFGWMYCCGTHVKTTKEIGQIILKCISKGKDIVRVEISVNDINEMQSI